LGGPLMIDNILSRPPEKSRCVFRCQESAEKG
jgi:hypothetical protein